MSTLQTLRHLLDAVLLRPMRKTDVRADFPMVVFQDVTDVSESDETPRCGEAAFVCRFWLSPALFKNDV